MPNVAEKSKTKPSPGSGKRPKAGGAIEGKGGAMPKNTGGTKTKPKGKPKSKSKKPGKPKTPPLTAATADRHALYQAAVQNVEAEIDFVDKTFLKLRGRPARLLREDFCGTGNTSCEWVQRRVTNVAMGLDIDAPTLDWGREHCVGTLTPDQQERVHLLERDVLAPGDAVGVDCVLAMNFSYWLFQTRSEMVRYLRSVRESLTEDGILFQDFYGGSEAFTQMDDEDTPMERRKCKLPDGRAYTYVWDQHEYNPITGEMHCRIHFEFKDKTVMRDAFTYTWRLWTLPEMRELLAEAGFSKTTVYWEGDELDDEGEPTGEGNGVFTPTTTGSADPAYICYVVSEK
jgi:hypothetical protein